MVWPIFAGLLGGGGATAGAGAGGNMLSGLGKAAAKKGAIAGPPTRAENAAGVGVGGMEAPSLIDLAGFGAGRGMSAPSQGGQHQVAQAPALMNMGGGDMMMSPSAMLQFAQSSQQKRQPRPARQMMRGGFGRGLL